MDDNKEIPANAPKWVKEKIYKSSEMVGMVTEVAEDDDSPF